MTDQELLNEAIKARELSYSPYSNFKVGAAVLLKDGSIIPGANIENASYSLTMCAERNALFQTYLNGYNKDDIEAIAIVGDSEKLVSPCGACRQVFVELLNYDTPVIFGTICGLIKKTTVKDLLPYAFDKENL